jgi:CBS domain-containing protein
MKSIKEILQERPLLTAKLGDSIRKVVNYMAEKNIGLVPVLAPDGKLEGVFSERDLVRRVITREMDLDETKVEDVMTKDLILADKSETYESCLKKMKDAGIRHIIIIEENKLLGILSMRDLLEIDIVTKKETIEVLHNYIYST